MGKISKNLQVRALTGIILLPPVLGSVLVGGALFQVFLLIATFMMAREWHKITGQGGRTPTLATFIVVGAGTLLLPLMFTDLAPGESLRLMFGVLVGLFAGFVLMSALSRRYGLKRLWWVAGSCYIALAVWGLMWLRLSENGALTVIWLLFVVWGTDVGGYFAGKALGGPKLAPRISPGKTWAGFFGGIALAAAVSVAISAMFVLWEPVPLALLAIFLSIVSQIGDLFESALKRHFDLKDSGGLIPGHGGILDRVDGLAFASPMCAFLFICVVLYTGTMPQ